MSMFPDEGYTASTLDKLEWARTDKPSGPCPINVGTVERLASVVAGAMLVNHGLGRGRLLGLASVALGAGLVYRGVTGRCAVYRLLDRNTADSARNKGFHGVKIESSVIVNRTPEELYLIWRDFSSQPKFSSHVESVVALPEGKTRWTIRGPLGKTFTWDAEIIQDRPGELIAWRSVEDADVRNAGSVRFEPVAGGQGTKVEVIWSLDPPLGGLTRPLAELFHWLPQQEIDRDLERFKQWVETGMLPEVAQNRPIGAST